MNLLSSVQDTPTKRKKISRHRNHQSDHLNQKPNESNRLLETLLSGGIPGIARTFLRGMLFGLGSKVLFSLTSFKSFQRLFLTSTGRKNALRSGVLFGTMISIFKSLSCLGVHLLGGKRREQLPTIVCVSALIAAQSLRLELSPSRRSLFATYALVRACWSILQDVFMKEEATTKDEDEELVGTSIVRVLLNHGAPMLFVVSCTQIMWCWFYYPIYLQGLYATWITRMAHMDVALVQALHDLHHGKVKYGMKSNILRDYSLRHHLNPDKANLLHYVPMKYVHPSAGNWTSMWLLRRFVRGIIDSFPLYFPVHALPMFIFKSHVCVETPYLAARKLFSNVLQSSTFLASFITLTWGGILIIRKWTRRDTSFGVWFGCVASGLSIYVERPTRRRELAMFVFPRVLEIWWEMSGRVEPVRHFATWIFSSSMAVLAERSLRPKDTSRNLFSGIGEMMFR